MSFFGHIICTLLIKLCSTWCGCVVLCCRPGEALWSSAGILSWRHWLPLLSLIAVLTMAAQHLRGTEQIGREGYVYPTASCWIARQCIMILADSLATCSIVSIVWCDDYAGVVSLVYRNAWHCTFSIYGYDWIYIQLVTWVGWSGIIESKVHVSSWSAFWLISQITPLCTSFSLVCVKLFGLVSQPVYLWV